MLGQWRTAVETAADTLGEMLIEMAEGRREHDNEQLAAAVLRSAVAVLVEAPPSAQRLEAVGRALYAKLHNGGDAPWSAMRDIERGFWLDIAAACVAAADAGLLEDATP